MEGEKEVSASLFTEVSTGEGGAGSRERSIATRGLEENAWLVELIFGRCSPNCTETSQRKYMILCLT